MIKRKRAAIILISILGILVLCGILFSCSLAPLAGSMLGAGAGGLAGPGGAMLGSAAGYGAGKVVEDMGSDDAAAAIAEKVEGLSSNDIQTLIDSTVGNHRSFFETVLDDVMAILQVAGILLIVFIVGNLVWTYRRKLKGEHFYKELEKLKEKMK